MKAQKIVKYLDFFCALLILSQIVLIGAAFYAEIKTQQANKIRFESVRLAEELRHSSRDLTAAARAYVATGDIYYWRAFSNVLDIRKGVKSRPDGRTIPLRTLFSEAGFNADEMKLLDAAENKSDTLTNVEMTAMKMIKNSSEKDLSKSRAKAIEMVHGISYRDQAQDIMIPILRFEDSINQRTLNDVQTYDFLTRTVLVVLVITAILNLCIFYALSLLKFGNPQSGI